MGAGSGAGWTPEGVHRVDFSEQQRGEWLYVPDPAKVVAVGDEQLVVMIAGRMLLGFELVSGKPAWAPRDIGFPPVRPPIYKDFDGDGAPEMLVIAQESVATSPYLSRMQLTVLSLLTHEPLWAPRTINAHWGYQLSWHQPAKEWPVVGDLDGDGLAEIIIPNVSQPGPFGGIEVLDGRTGQSRWNRKLRCMDKQIERFIIGPDINARWSRITFHRSSRRIVGAAPRLRMRRSVRKRCGNIFTPLLYAPSGSISCWIR